MTPDPTNTNLKISIPKTLIGFTIEQAQKYYNPIREIISNGTRLNIRSDYVPVRMNVETINCIIIRIDGYY